MNTARNSGPRLVTIGETLASISSSLPKPLRNSRQLELGIGGAESNVATAAARLGVDSAWLGRVGDDELGRLIVRELKGEGVDVRAVVDQTHPTALMLKSHRTSTLMNVNYYRRQSAGSRLAVADIDTALVSNASVLHVSAITPALSASARDAIRFAVSCARDAGVTVSVDLNYRAALWSPDEAGPEFRYLVSEADILFSTLEEARIASPRCESPEEAARYLTDLGARHVLVKQGSRGALSLQDGSFTAVDAFPVKPIDNIGAGDAFAAGYLSSMIRGGSLQENLAWAAALGAWAVSTVGDWEGLPTLPELLAFLDTDPEGESVLR